jgi:hypothetical protein
MSIHICMGLIELDLKGDRMKEGEYAGFTLQMACNGFNHLHSYLILLSSGIDERRFTYVETYAHGQLLF